jgi:hypothetical protein
MAGTTPVGKVSNTMKDGIRITVNPEISDDQLFEFYQRNHICEEGYGKERASVVLHHSSLIIGAFEGDKLVGITRAMCDGLSVVVMEFCVELKYQGKHLEYENGSLIGKDDFGIGRRMGETLISELRKMGADFMSCNIVKNYEEAFYQSVGFECNPDSAVFIMDNRPYKGDERYVTKQRI